jgi:alpha 1,2-mannosyltransferase
VHSIAAALMLKKEELHFFNDIAYYHVPFTHCPTGEKTREALKCHCNPKDNFDWKGYSCMILPFLIPIRLTIADLTSSIGTSRYFDINNLEKPKGWEDEAE